MSAAPRYEIWEIGDTSAPPFTLSSLMVGDERLLWSAVLPANLQRARWLWGILMSLAFAALMLSDVWGRSWTEYCGNNTTARCNYPISWLLVIVLTIFAGSLVHLVVRNHLSPFSYFFGISTKRALWIAGYKPGKVWSSQLDTNAAGIDWFGSVRFGSARTGLSFLGLNERDANRAVYWANEGRLRSDIPEQAR